MRVRFTQLASVQGVGYRVGSEATLPDDVGQVYVQVGQAVQIDEPKEIEAAEPTEPGTPARQRKAGKTTVKRGRRRAETAERADRETR